MAKGKTQKYYDANPAANKRRIAQQKRYNKNGKGNEIARKAVELNRKMGTYGNGAVSYTHLTLPTKRIV